MVAVSESVGIISKASRGRFPYYHLVPKDIEANLAFRKELIELGSSSREQAHELWIMCCRDYLFYLNSFVWTYSPKDFSHDPVRPFITWPCQDEAFAGLMDAIGKEDILFEKSRDMGASWIAIAAFEYLWHFRDRQSFLMVSRKEEYVDKSGDSKSLMWKIDFILEHLPGWLVPTYSRQKLHFENRDNGSIIDGESTQGDVARGDRRTAILLDEFASVERDREADDATRDATNCRIFNSTPKGANNVFYRLAHNDQMRKVRLHWTQHPIKAAGLWYGPDGRPHSPWYDLECKKRTPHSIRQELDIDYLGSDVMFFDPLVLDRVIQRDVMPPLFEGELDFDTVSLEPTGFVARSGGRWKLWVKPDGFGKIPISRPFGVAADVATGTGASNSTISVGVLETGEKIAEYAEPSIDPHKLGQLLVATGRLFKGPDGQPARLIWEANGMGRSCGKAVLANNYPNVYYRQSQTSTGKGATFPGWYSTPETKQDLFNEYRIALNAGTFVNRSDLAVRECWHYVYSPSNDTVVNRQSITTDDPSGAKANHGDRVIADALLCRLTRGNGLLEKKTKSYGPNTAYARIMKNLRTATRPKETVKPW